MTREEKMWKSVENEHGVLSKREAFIALTAMEWADETMIDKACEWLSEIDFDSDYFRDAEGYFDNNQLIEELKKAMEE